MISVDEALTRILEAMPRMGSEEVDLRTARDRFLAEDVAANLTQPPFDISAMDGYAVHGSDVQVAPATLQKIGEVAAGGAFTDDIPRGSCVRIFTGGRVPESVDTIVIQENVSANGPDITVNQKATLAQHVRPSGSDFSTGDVLLKSGVRLTARDVSLAAAMNVASLKVARKPRVAILATGNELALPGEDLGPNQIVSSNAFGLAAMVEAWGGEAIDLGIALDTEEDLRAKAAPAKEADLFMTIGGASVGDHDLIQKVLVKDGLKVGFWKIAQKPGKPLIFGTFDNVPMLGLPGNPVSALVCAQLYLKPSLFALQGDSNARNANQLQTAVLGDELKENGPRQDHIRAMLELTVDGVLVAHPAHGQGSGHLAALARADCLIVRKPGAHAAVKGDSVSVLIM
jgi:molybdopterin molybdotransferase